MRIMSDFTKKTKFRELKNRERMKTKENLFDYIEILEQQVMSLNERLKKVEANWAIRMAEEREGNSNQDKEEQWWELNPIPIPMGEEFRDA